MTSGKTVRSMKTAKTNKAEPDNSNDHALHAVETNHNAVELKGSQIFIQALLNQGVDTIFGYPGGVLLGLYDELYKAPELRHILIRHEQGGTHAADGYARATGKPGVLLVTSGPGATNAVTGITTAMMDSIPLVVFTGQVPSSLIGNDAFQEADTIGITRPITKHSYLVKDASDLSWVIPEAFHVAQTGRPGPVLIDLPKDMLNSTGTYTPDTKVSIRGYNIADEGDFGQISNAAELLNNAKKPLIYAGGGVLSGEAWKELRELAETTGAPVTTTLMGLGSYPENDEQSLGMLGMHGTWWANMAIQECDVLLAVGARFDDRVTGKVDEFSTKSKKIHIDIDPSCINKNVQVEVPIIGNTKTVLQQLNQLVQPLELSEWYQQIDTWKTEHPLRYKKPEKGIAPQHLMEMTSEITKGEAIVTVDVGQHQMWAAQYYKFNHPRSWLSSSGLGTMGFGFPSGIGAKVACPDREVVCITGDGGFQMTAMELGTAVAYNIPVKVVIMNNHYLGMVRQWQELFFGGRYSHSHLEQGNPDFVALAESYGAVGMRAESPEEFREIMQKAMTITDKPVIMDVHVEQEENVYPMIPPGAAVHDMVDTELPTNHDK